MGLVYVGLKLSSQFKLVAVFVLPPRSLVTALYVSFGSTRAQRANRWSVVVKANKIILRFILFFVIQNFIKNNKNGAKLLLFLSASIIWAKKTCFFFCEDLHVAIFFLF